jgi:hypothetical protein
VIFNDNVTHNGDEIRTSPTNTTVFFGNVTGAGPFTGPGTVRFEGTFSPGNSPAVVTLEGDLSLGSDAILNMELGGTSEGSQYDRLDVAGPLSIDGALEVSLLNQFQPTLGDRFDLFDYLALDGRFDNIKLPLLPAVNSEIRPSYTRAARYPYRPYLNQRPFASGLPQASALRSYVVAGSTIENNAAKRLFNPLSENAVTLPGQRTASRPRRRPGFPAPVWWNSNPVRGLWLFRIT